MLFGKNRTLAMDPDSSAYAEVAGSKSLKGTCPAHHGRVNKAKYQHALTPTTIKWYCQANSARFISFFLLSFVIPKCPRSIGNRTSETVRGTAPALRMSRWMVRGRRETRLEGETPPEIVHGRYSLRLSSPDRREIVDTGRKRIPIAPDLQSVVLALHHQ